MSTPNEIPSRDEGCEVPQKAIEQVKLNPDDWSARKLAASLLYDFKKYAEAAELLWEAPKMPYKSKDIAFSVRIIAKGNSKNAIRLVNAVLRRIGKNAEACLNLAQAFHVEGLPLLASRVYGAALAVNNDNFDIGFEQESLWFDDHGELVAEWGNQGHEPSAGKPAGMKNFLGKAISFLEYTQRITECVKGEGGDSEVSKEPAAPIFKATPAPAVPAPAVRVIPAAAQLIPVRVAPKLKLSSTKATVPLLIPKAKPVEERK